MSDAFIDKVQAAMDDVLADLAGTAKKPAAAVAAPAPQPQPVAAAGDASVPDRIDAAVAAAIGRVFAVMESPAAKARPKMALALAKSGLPAAAAEAILAAAPEETPAAAVVPAADATVAALGNALERQMAVAGNSARVAPEAEGAASRPTLAEKMKARAKKA